MPQGCLPFLIFMGIMVLLPLFLMNAVMTALVKLGFSPEAGLSILLWIFFGSLVNIPVKRLPREEDHEVRPVTAFGLDRVFKTSYSRRYMIVAVNLGGGITPCLIVAYEWVMIMRQYPHAIFPALLATLINILVCYKMARPIPKLGIGLPALLPGLVAALSAMLLVPSMAPPVAFIAGVLGPLIGADLMHLRDISQLRVGIVSIGGAGTFDGIVLSGIIAALLA
jgi:uncharacterized membrane protein